MEEQTRVISIERLTEQMEFLSSLHDVVRVVDPERTEILKLEDGKLVESEMDSCFKIWDRNERCVNCISQRACQENHRFLKFEFREKEVYSVVAYPFVLEVNGKKFPVSLELANNVTENAIVNFDSQDHHLTEVAIVRDKIYRDSLTGVYNRRFYDERQFVKDPTEAIEEKVCFMVGDIDHFKTVNDTYGHDCGDELLAEVAKKIRASVRKTDCVIRTGGDEFLVILHNADEALAKRKVAEMKEKVSSITMKKYQIQHPVISIGYACMNGFTGSEEQQNELYRQADEAMYQVKKFNEAK